MLYPQYYKQASVTVDGIEIQPFDLLDLYPFSFATVLKYLTRERYHNTQAQDYSKALTYLSRCRVSCVIYPVRPVTVLELRTINAFRRKFSLIEALLSPEGVSDTARMTATKNELERAISAIHDAE